MERRSRRGGGTTATHYLAHTPSYVYLTFPFPQAFPGWHRPYLLEFERMLRRADMALGGDGAIGLPYWDWSEAEVKGEVLPGIIRKRLHGEFADDFFPTPPHRLAKLSDTQSDSSIKRSLEGARVAELAHACLTSVNHGQHACTRFSSARSPSLEQSHNSM